MSQDVLRTDPGTHNMNWLKLYIMSFFVTDFLVARQNSICYKVFSRATMHSILKNDTSKIIKKYHPHFGDLLFKLYIYFKCRDTTCSGVTQNFMGSSSFDP
jgi:hypothetical protein